MIYSGYIYIGVLFTVIYVSSCIHDVWIRRDSVNFLHAWRLNWKKRWFWRFSAISISSFNYWNSGTKKKRIYEIVSFWFFFLPWKIILGFGKLSLSENVKITCWLSCLLREPYQCWIFVGKNEVWCFF